MKDKVTGFLVDPHGAITIQIWEDFIPQVQEGGKYTFKNLSVHKTQCNGSLFVAIPNGCHCAITPRNEFLSLWPPQLTHLILSLQRQLKLNLLHSKHLPSTSRALSATLK